MKYLLNQIMSPQWVDTWARDMVIWYWSVAILFWQLSIDHIVNVLKSYIKDVDLPRHAWDTPPFLLIVSPTLPVQSVDAYVRSVNHVKTKRKEVEHILWVWGSVPRTLRARRSPAMTWLIWPNQKFQYIHFFDVVIYYEHIPFL